MISQESLIQALTQTFKGETSEQVHQAEEELKSQYQYSEFPSLLCQMIETTFSGNLQLCRASIIQLKGYLIANPQFIAEQGVNLFVQLALILSPNLLQILEIIADVICKFDEKNDIGLLQAFQPLLTSDSPISGFILLDSYFELNDSIPKEHFENINELINAEFQIVQQILENSPNDPKVPFYLHYFSTACVSHLIQFAPEPEQINPYYLFSNQIIKSEYTTTIFDIPSDFYEVIFNCVILHEDSFDPNIFLSSAETYFQHSPSNQGLTQFYKIIKIFLKTEKTFSVLLENLPQLIESFFYPVFQMTEDDQASFENDPEKFLDDVFPSFLEEETPRSSAASCLYESAENQEIVSKIVFSFVIQTLNNGTQFNSWELFSLILFFSTCSQFYSDECAEFEQFIEQVISTNIQSTDPILVSLSLIFLANFPNNFNSTLSCKNPLVTASIYSLSNNASHPIICYLSCCACGQLLKLIKEKEPSDDSSLEIPPESLAESITNLFVTSEQFKTERMAQSVFAIIDFFTTSNDQILSQSTEQAITAIMHLLIQYMQDDTEEAHKNVAKFSDAIHSLCTKVKIENQTLFDFVLEKVESMIDEQLHDTYLEDILPLIDGCVKGCGTTITEQIASIPQKLSMLIEGEGIAEALQISQIYKSFSLKFFKSDDFDILSLINPIVEMMPNLIEEAEAYQGDELEAITNFTQILFIFISNFAQSQEKECEIDLNQCIIEWIEPLSVIDSEFAADSLAAMIQFSPSAAFSNPELPVFNNWIANSRPKAFLASAMSVLKNLSSIQEVFDQEMRQNVLERSQKELESKNYESEEIEENNEFFNMDSIKAFFGKINQSH